MQAFMLRLDRVIRRRQRIVLVLWAAVLLTALPFAARQSEHLSGGGFGVPGSQSERVQEQLERDFSKVERAQLGVVLVPREGATAKQLRAAVERVDRAARAEDHVGLDAAARRRALQAAEQRAPIVFALATTGIGDDEATDVASGLRERLGINDGARDGVRTHLIGQGALWAGMQDLSKKDLQKAEATGFPIVLLILLAVFGSLAAALLPLALGFVSVLVTGGLIFATSTVMDMSVFVTNMSSMIGIGVAVDYSLFVLARYREELHAGRSRDEARARAMATSGIAVLFSGLTVIVSLAGLFMIDNNAIRSMALGAILVVAVSLLASATLLPALIRLLGHRAYRRSRAFTVLGLAARTRSRRRRGSTVAGASHVGFWQRWTSFVMRRPVVSIVVASALLVVAAAPVLDLKTGNGALRQFPEGNETRVGFEVAASQSRPGDSSPLRVVVGSRDTKVLDAVRSRLERDPEIASVARSIPSDDRASTLLLAIPRRDGESDRVKQLVRDLRADLPGVAARADAGATVLVGGVPAALEDIRELVAGSMWKLMLFVLGLSYLVLLVLLRSVVLPLKAVLMNLLSVGASYGALVAVFQYGWADGLFGFQSNGYVDTLTPPLVLAVVFGLSMDYEVFLLSRIRERFEISGDTRRAVAEGLSSSARTISSAALIMVAVFAVFIGTGVPSIKQIGLGCAVAIAVDATLVRLVLVPAAMELLGKWNWYLPSWLDRVLPHSSFEQLPEDVVEAPARDRELVAV